MKRIAIFDEFAHALTNTKIAKAIEIIAERLDSALAQAILQEAAGRLRGEPEPHFAVPLPDLPPLDAQAAPDANSTPLGILVDHIAYEAIQKVR